MVNVDQFNRRKRFSFENKMNIRFSKKKVSSIIDLRVKFKHIAINFSLLKYFQHRIFFSNV